MPSLVKETIKARIEEAFKSKELFFKPWIGNEYEKGVSISGSFPIKLLVIGASRYCEYSNHRELNNETLCPHLEGCVNCCDYDDLMRIATDCPFVNDRSARNNTHLEYGLYNINQASILKVMAGNNLPKAYSVFQEVMSDKMACEKKDIWKHLAFFNCIQPIVWGEDPKKRTRTPSFHECKNIYTQSRPIIKTIIEILEPDLIFLWQSKPIKEAFNELFPDACLRKYKVPLKTSSGREREYKTYRIKVNGKEIPLFPSPHPSEYGMMDSYLEKVELFTESYMTPYSFGKERKTYESYRVYPWRDFMDALDELVIDEFYEL